MLTVNERISIPFTEMDFTFSRSGGPGGQNVNKVNTKVTLRWNVDKSAAVASDVRDRFCERYRRRITKDGDLVLHSQRYRDQGRNVADCLSKLRALLLDVAEAPKPRRPTRRSRASVERRLANKRRMSERKKLRRRPSEEE